MRQATNCVLLQGRSVQQISRVNHREIVTSSNSPESPITNSQSLQVFWTNRALIPFFIEGFRLWTWGSSGCFAMVTPSIRFGHLSGTSMGSKDAVGNPHDWPWQAQRSYGMSGFFTSKHPSFWWFAKYFVKTCQICGWPCPNFRKNDVSSPSIQPKNWELTYSINQ